MKDRHEINKMIAERNRRREPVGDVISTEEEASFTREMAANRFIKKHGLAMLCLAKFNPETGEYEAKR